MNIFYQFKLFHPTLFMPIYGYSELLLIIFGYLKILLAILGYFTLGYCHGLDPTTQKQGPVVLPCLSVATVQQCRPGSITACSSETWQCCSMQ